nr:MAG TPA: hypothetical protein [Caudoviricetes sp.]
MRSTQTPCEQHSPPISSQLCLQPLQRTTGATSAVWKQSTSSSISSTQQARHQHPLWSFPSALHGLQ